MRAPSWFHVLLCAAACATRGESQTAPSSAPSVPIRTLGAPNGVSDATFGSVGSVRQLADGRLLINDAARRQVVLLDASLHGRGVIIDSVSGADNSYGAESAILVASLADTTLFAEGATKSFLVIDPGGRVVRVMALPGTRSSYLYLTSTLYGVPSVSAGLGLVFGMPQGVADQPRRPAPGSPDITVLLQDTNTVVAINMATRRLDTLFKYSTGRGMPAVLSSSGTTRMPMPSFAEQQMRVADNWAMTSDGSIAIVRGRDYRIDWINPDGSRSASPRIPYDWQPIRDDDKMRFADSLNRRTIGQDSMMVTYWRQDSIATAAAIAAGRGDSIRAERPGAPGRAGGPVSLFRPRPTPSTLLNPSNLPDYLPAIETLSGSVLADGDNNVWIRSRPRVRVPDGVVWDVVDRKGILIDRVKVPMNRAIAGFGPGGIIYLVGGNGVLGGMALGERVSGAVRVTLERVKWR